MQTENREFAVHRNLQVSGMQSQAGTLGKALLEAVMNSIDAGATRVTVKLDKSSFSIRDDGRGIQSKTEMVEWFEAAPGSAGV